MQESVLMMLILVPLAAACVSALLPRKLGVFAALLGVFLHAACCFFLMRTGVSWSAPWVGFGFDFSLRITHLSGWVLAAVACFGVLIAVYALGSFTNAGTGRRFLVYLLVSLAFSSGALLADNLALLLFFWEGLLIMLFAMISLGSASAWRTALKAFIIVGVADFCLMAGIALAAHTTGTLSMSVMRVPLDAAGTLAFILLFIGAAAKAGAMPFHSWIPDAAQDAPVAFMAFFPAAVEKLLGIYFLARITLDLFALESTSALSSMMMWAGVSTIIFAVMMALIQKDYKKLLSYHAISQVGYMILGVGTCVPLGIAGGLFHMINHAVYKSGLFLTAGAVERQAGSTDLHRLGGLAARMPVTFLCFIVCALSISGVPPFNGFFSKELVYEAARERGMIFYVLAAGGSFLTALSFLKLGHAAFLGRHAQEAVTLREAPWVMRVPMLCCAGVCVFFGLAHAFPLVKVIAPVANTGAHGPAGAHAFTGFHLDRGLTAATLVILAFAAAHHLFFSRRNGGALRAVDHLHHAPVLGIVYAAAEKGFLDPYSWGRACVAVVAAAGSFVDRRIDACYCFCAHVSMSLSLAIRGMHSGYYVIYIVWALIGSLALLVYLFAALRGG